jgi:imidazolonepropionase-like amidohydrolase
MARLMRVGAAALLLLAWAATATVQDELTVLRFARLIDGTGEVLSGNEIAIEHGMIRAVGADLAKRYPDARRVVLDELTALPGLVDVHVHTTYGLRGSAVTDPWSALFASPAPERLVAAICNADAMLRAGITTARDLFAADGVGYNLRALIDSRMVPGPRLFLAGAGIHPLVLPTAAGDEPRDLAALFAGIARSRAEEGADWIKIFATSGSADDLSDRQMFRYPEIKAATDAAHAAGLRVAVHSYGPSAVDDALRAGVDSIEHAIDVDDALIARWAAAEVTYVPTIDHNRYYAEHRAEYGYDEAVERDLWTFVDRNVETLRRIHAAGIPVAMGSDAVFTMFGQNARELEWFIEAGLTPAEAIRAATVTGATLLGQEHRLGRLAPDFVADIVAVRGNPLNDIRRLTRGVSWVMKAGEVVGAEKGDCGG